MLRVIFSLIIILCISIAGCGGSSSSTTTPDTTAPTVSSVKDANGATIELTASTGIFPTSFNIEFSEDMNDESVTTEGNIALACTDVEATISIAESATANTYTVTVTDPGNYGYQDCALTIGTNVTDAAGNAIAEDAIYSFSTQCSTDDTFTVDTLGFTDDNDTEGSCWNYQHQTSEGNVISRATYFTVVTEDGVMRYTTADPAGKQNLAPPYSGHMIYKEFEASAFEAVIEFYGFIGAGPGNRCGLKIIPHAGSTVQLIFESSGASIAFYLGAKSGNQPLPKGFTPSSSDPLYLKIQWDGSKYYLYYRTGSESDFTEVLSTTPDTALTGSYQIGLYCSSNSTTFTQEIGSFTINATATGPGAQY